MDELLKARAELKAKIKALDAKIDAFLAIQSPTAEQAADAKKWEDEAAQLTKDREKLDARIEKKQAELDDDKRQVELETQATRTRQDELRQRRGGRRTEADVPNAGSVADVANLNAVPLPAANRGFKDHREFLTCVMQAGRGYAMDNRLVPLATAGSDEARGNSDPAGGFLLPQGFHPELMSIKPEDDPVGGLTTKIPMEAPMVKIPARVDTTHTTSVSGGLTVTRRPETVAGTPSQMSLYQISLEAHSLFGLSYASEEILARSPISFIAILSQGFSQQFAGHLLNERLNGTGVGEFLGICNAANAALITVTKESGQAAATIVKENIDKMRSRCWGYSRAIWLANHDCLPQLSSLAQIVGIGGAPVQYLSVDTTNNTGTLAGRPIYFSEFTQTIGTAGDLVLANWSEYLEGTYQPMASAESIHVRFVNHERTFKFWMENCGQPWWKAPLTPKYSTTTLSPFVVMGARA